ncbi:Septin-domain-containing protein [Thelephora terrestris]|uniref:Septin-domain-containing protein n=1 Tax=Thelephora terrestris TaxID=56493 RepID=A0A9P6L4H1_9AGAM|nr:Septin-domain-containing protein [Thelephora terrestris]
MFSFRSRKQKRDANATQGVRTYPSLPELSVSQGVKWPTGWVDVSALDAQLRPNEMGALKGPDSPIAVRSARAAKTSFSADKPPAFHRPLWDVRNANGKESQHPIGAIYGAGKRPPPSAFDKKAARGARVNPRRGKVAPTFNLMIVGGQGTGKTSLLQLLLDTADISPTATPDQRAAVDKFIRGSPERTQEIKTACVEICESKYDRVLLTVVDTPGLDFRESRELNLEWQVSSILKYVDQQYADTLSEEAKVIRQSKGDQHIHLCLYMINPHSVMSTAERKALLSVPSSSGLSTPNPSRATNGHLRQDSEDVDQPRAPKRINPSELTLLPSEIRVIKRLSKRVNVLPIIGCADSLTDERLSAIKETIRNELADAGLDFGVFGPPNFDQDPAQNGHSIDINLPKANARQATADPEDVEEEEEDRKSRGVIRLRLSRFTNPRRSRSRNRRDTAYSYASDGENLQNGVQPLEEDSVANVRFSASHFQHVDLSDLLPFALISPEAIPERVASTKPSRRHTVHSPVPADLEREGSGSDYGEDRSPNGAPSINGDGYGQSNLPYLDGPPSDLRGVFVRKFRWGTIDVLNPDHCDFAALRTAVLSTHMMMLKVRTKEVLYEKFRTEKLLARRATKNIADADKKKLLEGNDSSSRSFSDLLSSIPFSTSSEPDTTTTAPSSPTVTVPTRQTAKSSPPSVLGIPPVPVRSPSPSRSIRSTHSARSTRSILKKTRR